MKKLTIILLLLCLVGCMPKSIGYGTDTFGFFSGFCHGFIVLGTFFISIFMDGLNIYAANNTGFFYNFGFLLGIWTLFGTLIG